MATNRASHGTAVRDERLTTLRMHPQLMRRLSEAAKEKGYGSRAALIRVACEEFLARQTPLQQTASR